MKKIQLTLAAILIAFCSFAQGNELSGSINQNSIIINKTGEPALPSASTIAFGQGGSTEDFKYEGENYHTDKCSTYHKMKIAGIILSAVGGGMIITGSIIVGSAHQQNYEGTIDRGNYYSMVNAGSAMVGLGTLSLGAGIPLAIIGGVKSHRCYGGGERSYMELSTTGNGLALAF